MGSNNGLLQVKATVGPLHVNWRDSQRQVHQWLAGASGPRFFEETSYRLRVKSLSEDNPPVLLHRDPNLLRDIDSYPDDNMSAGPINFQRQVGQSVFEIRVGHETLFLTVEVFPVKLDYEQDYKSLLSDVASAARGLALEYLRATYQTGSASEKDHVTDLEWLTLLRHEFEILERSVRFINDHPHRLLSRQPENIHLEKVKCFDTSVRRALIRGHGTGPLVEISGVGYFHQDIPGVLRKETLDIPEHKWLRFNLSLISRRLGELHASVAKEIEKYEGSLRPTPKRLQVEESELAKFVLSVEELLSLQVFNGVNGFPPPGFASLSLLSGVGYGLAYRAITVLRLGLDVQGHPFEFSVKDVHELYEVWCFIQLVRQVASLISGQADSLRLLKIEESGIRVRLRRGEHSAICLTSRDSERRVVISYNPSFAGLTGDQRPDVVLRIQQAGWPDLIVVFDAKYRLDASEAYITRFNTIGPPQDAINAIHRYRDAIVVDSVDHGMERPVVKGAALFPLAAEESRNFTSSPLFEALDKLGVGALPFLPSNTSLVDDWLRSLLAMTPEMLAEPGPPFAGLAEKHQRFLEAH